MQKHIVYDIYFHKINQYYNLQKLKKMRKMHFFQLSSLITFEILQMSHFWGVLPPCFTSLAIRKIILRHPKCLQKNSKACFFPLVRCGRDGTENPSFTHILKVEDWKWRLTVILWRWASLSIFHCRHREDCCRAGLNILVGNRRDKLLF